MATTIPTQRVDNNSLDAYSWGAASEIDGSTGFNTVNNNARQGRSVAAGFYYQAGYIFTTVPIPQGATIISASISVLAHKGLGTRGDTVNWKIVGMDTDNIVASWSVNYRPGTGGVPGRDPETTAKVDWDRTGFVANTRYTSPDIASIIQEIVDRPGWVFDNNLAIVIRNDGANDGYAVIQHPALGENNIDAAYFDCTYTPSGGQVIRVNII